MSEVRIARFKCGMQNGDIALRLRHLRDFPALYSLFNPEIFRVASGAQSKPFDSLLGFWRWMVKTFQVVFVIEARRNGETRIIGFVGLYDIQIGRSLWVSMALFDPVDRGRGYGRHALALLLDSLYKGHLVKTVYAEIIGHNRVSLHFFKKMGFGVYGHFKDRFLMQKILDGRYYYRRRARGRRP